MPGCAYEDGGTLTAAALDVPDCHQRDVTARLEPFRFPIHFMGIHAASDAVTVRLGPAATEAWRADQLVFSVPAAVVAAANGAAFQVELDDAPIGSPNLGRLSIIFARTCAIPSAALVGRGHVEITAWGVGAGDRIAGSIIVDLVDPRSGEVRGAAFGGDFDMVVKSGTPYTAFAPTHF